MKKITFYIFGFIATGLFLSAFCYVVLFLNNIIVPISVDSGVEGPFFQSILINVLLLALFGIQHSIMARKGFKAFWIKYIPAPIERSTFVLLASIICWALMIHWQPLTGIVWDINDKSLRIIIYGMFVLSALICFYSMILLNIFDYVGLRQIYLHFKEGKYIPLELKKPILYRIVRHPMTLSILAVFWLTPTMTYGHLLWAVGFTIYSLIGLSFEECDLNDLYGEDYNIYKNQVRMLLPIPKKKSSSAI